MLSPASLYAAASEGIFLFRVLIKYYQSVFIVAPCIL